MEIEGAKRPRMEGGFVATLPNLAEEPVILSLPMLRPSGFVAKMVVMGLPPDFPKKSLQKALKNGGLSSQLAANASLLPFKRTIESGKTRMARFWPYSLKP